MNSGRNLPPGCFERDLPGNTPEDEAFEDWYADHEDELSGLGEYEINNRFWQWWNNR